MPPPCCQGVFDIECFRHFREFGTPSRTTNALLSKIVEEFSDQINES